MHHHEPITLKRDTEATQIPSGYHIVLPAGSTVTVTQTLGGNFTVITEGGTLVRISDKDADSLGDQYVAAAAAAQEAAKAIADGPFEQEKVWDQLRTVFDPEIPVNIVDLGLVYACDASDHPEGGKKLDIKMTMTAPGCGMGGVLKEDVHRKVLTVPGVREAQVEVVWEPPWDQSRMSEAARLQLGWM
jgi:probable FeS assembly SUF system protein SufT